VVVPTFQREELLGRCLGGLLRQGLAPRDFEIIVVDDARSEGTPRLVQEIAGESGPRVGTLSGRSQGPATARNMGWRRAEGEIIAFIDDDAYPANDRWLTEGLKPFADPDVVAVTGPVKVPVDKPPADFQRNVKRLEEASFLTCNSFVRRSALERIGGFDERFRLPYREDTDLQFRLEACGGRIVRNPAAIVIHPAPRGRFGISIRLQRYSMYNALLYKKHPARFRRDVERLPPLRYYAMLGSLSAALPSFALGAPLVGGVLGLVALSLYAQFVWKRLRGASHEPRHVLEMLLTSALIPPLSVYWRLRGALRFRVLYF
jgi:GT2 family glycosyltransferase